MKNKISNILSYVAYTALLYFSVEGNVFCKNLLNAFVTLSFISMSVITSIIVFIYLMNDRGIITSWHNSVKNTNVKNDINSEYQYLRWMFSAATAATMFGMGWYVIGTMSTITFISGIILRETVKNLLEQYESDEKSQ